MSFAKQPSIPAVLFAFHQFCIFLITSFLLSPSSVLLSLLLRLVSQLCLFAGIADFYGVELQEIEKQAQGIFPLKEPPCPVTQGF